MGNVCGSNDTDAFNRNREIEVTLAKHAREIYGQIKLLLLGTGESGKSTLFKQMKILQDGGGFTEDERIAFKSAIYSNLISQMKILCTCALENNYVFDNEQTQTLVERMHETNSLEWSSELAEMIETLWVDPDIQTFYSKPNPSIQLNDSASYFFDSVSRIKTEPYIPSTDDVLRVRVRSTGIEEATFKLGDFSFKMIDVGGQRNERKKWIHCFDSVTAVIFCAGLSEYDQLLREDNTTNRLKESLLLFQQMSNSQYFKNTTFILFLNKKDLFEKKIQIVPLSTYFPAYTGGKDLEQALSFIRDRFLALSPGERSIYVHYTIALDSQNIAYVFSVVKETLMKTALTELF